MVARKWANGLADVEHDRFLPGTALLYNSVMKTRPAHREISRTSVRINATEGARPNAQPTGTKVAQGLFQKSDK
jgi:hypothetical protein